MNKEFNLKLIPIIIGVIFLIIFIFKSTVTIESGQAGVLYKTFDGGVVTNEPPLGEGFHIVAPWNKVFVYEVRQQELSEQMQVLSSNGLEIKLDATAWFHPQYEFTGKLMVVAIFIIFILIHAGSSCISSNFRMTNFATGSSGLLSEENRHRSDNNSQVGNKFFV